MFKNTSTILLIITIIILLAIISFNILNNNKHFIKIKKKTKELFFNSTNQNNNQTNKDKKFNEITYGMNPKCYDGSNNTTLSKYCPNKHPNIPCSLVKDCNGGNNVNNKLTDTMKRDIYMYVYLTGLLESTDIFNADKDHHWY